MNWVNVHCTLHSGSGCIVSMICTKLGGVCNVHQWAYEHGGHPPSSHENEKACIFVWLAIELMQPRAADVVFWAGILIEM